MGLDPKTKANCDREIARLESEIQVYQGQLNQYRGMDTTSIKNNIARTKSRIRELKALRKTLPNK